MINIRKLESELWESADLLRQGSKLTSSQYCMPVLALLFLRYAYSRFKMVETEILENRPKRGDRVMPVEASDFAAKSALFLPKEAFSPRSATACCRGVWKNKCVNKNINIYDNKIAKRVG